MFKARSDGGVLKEATAWGAVFALSLCAFALIAYEFMPVSLLTPIVRDLGISEGQARQVICVSGTFAVLTSLLLPSISGRLDREVLLVELIVLMMVSGGFVAFALNNAVLMFRQCSRHRRSCAHRRLCYARHGHLAA